MKNLSSQTRKKNSGITSPLCRGDIYLANLDPTIGREIKKTRPVLIIQNDTGNEFSPVTIVAPISSVKEITKPLPIMVFLKSGEGNLGYDTYVDCGQIRTLDKNKRLIHKIGVIPTDKIYLIDKAIKISLALE